MSKVDLQTFMEKLKVSPTMELARNNLNISLATYKGLNDPLQWILKSIESGQVDMIEPEPDDVVIDKHYWSMFSIFSLLYVYDNEYKKLTIEEKKNIAKGKFGPFIITNSKEGREIFGRYGIDMDEFLVYFNTLRRQINDPKQSVDPKFSVIDTEDGNLYIYKDYATKTSVKMLNRRGSKVCDLTVRVDSKKEKDFGFEINYSNINVRGLNKFNLTIYTKQPYLYFSEYNQVNYDMDLFHGVGGFFDYLRNCLAHNNLRYNREYDTYEDVENKKYNLLINNVRELHTGKMIIPQIFLHTYISYLNNRSEILRDELKFVLYPRLLLEQKTVTEENLREMLKNRFVVSVYPKSIPTKENIYDLKSSIKSIIEDNYLLNSSEKNTNKKIDYIMREITELLNDNSDGKVNSVDGYNIPTGSVTYETVDDVEINAIIKYLKGAQYFPLVTSLENSYDRVGMAVKHQGNDNIDDVYSELDKIYKNVVPKGLEYKILRVIESKLFQDETLVNDLKRLYSLTQLEKNYTENSEELSKPENLVLLTRSRDNFPDFLRGAYQRLTDAAFDKLIDDNFVAKNAFTDIFNDDELKRAEEYNLKTREVLLQHFYEIDKEMDPIIDSTIEQLFKNRNAKNINNLKITYRKMLQRQHVKLSDKDLADMRAITNKVNDNLLYHLQLLKTLDLIAGRVRKKDNKYSKTFESNKSKFVGALLDEYHMIYGEHLGQDIKKNIGDSVKLSEYKVSGFHDILGNIMNIEDNCVAPLNQMDKLYHDKKQTATIVAANTFFNKFILSRFIDLLDDRENVKNNADIRKLLNNLDMANFMYIRDRNVHENDTRDIKVALLQSIRAAIVHNRVYIYDYLNENENIEDMKLVFNFVDNYYEPKRAAIQGFIFVKLKDFMEFCYRALEYKGTNRPCMVSFMDNMPKMTERDYK